MSVLSEINRIKSAVTAIINAIKNKGVAVPTNAKITDLAPLINSISTGGGGASVASCTLVFGVDHYGDLYVAYTKSDGTAHRDILPQNVDTTIDGIMCGSMIAMYSRDGSYFSPNGVPITELGTLGSCDIYSAPTTSGTYRLPFDRS